MKSYSKPPSSPVTDPVRSIDAEEVRAALPGGWTVENSGDGVVFGYATGRRGAEFPDPEKVSASFGIRRSDELWTAVWLEPSHLHGGRHVLSDHATGVKQRCIEWVAEKTIDLEEGIDG